MALFVPMLRLLMLFLNVYDSYKTLKPPPPSARNPSRPSVRGTTQRKRDMKGCLAVWLVWVSFALYERTLEHFVCLFIPFYDEFKSVLLLFLVVTRARGAEPIFLHLIRPVIKPHTKSIDAILDIMLMVGDFLFALSTYPIHVMLEWWINGFGYLHDRFSLESYSSDSTDEVNSSEVASSLLASFRQLSPNELALREDSRQMLRNSNGENSPARRVSKGSDQSNVPLASSSRHQIWYPSRSSDSDDDLAPLDRTLRPIETSHVEQYQMDDWRQYPAFPSAYPPTPIVTKSKLVSTSKAVSRSLYPPIPEENSRQGFQKLLLPPREPLNPSRAGVLSDKYLISGIPPFLTGQFANANDADDSNSTDGYENDDDDDFDVTLKTPLQPRGSARSRPHPRLFVSPPSVSVSSGVFSPSRSSALTTVDNGSPLRTDTDSSFSPSLNMVPSPIIGKKRSFPRTRPLIAKNRVREIEDESSENSVLQQLPNEESDERHSPDSGTVSHGLQCLASANASDAAGDVDSVSISEDSNADQERSPPEEKRRKVVRSSQVKAIESSRPVTHKSSSHASPPRTRSHSRLKVPKNNLLHHSELPAVVRKRKVGMLKSASGAVKSITAEPSKSGDAPLSTGSSAPADRDTSDAAPPKMSYRNSRRKK